MSSMPVSIERIEDAIRIQWSDQTVARYSAWKLRNACPCAVCRERKSSSASNPSPRTSLPVLSAAETLPLRIERMEPVGNYAYNIHFSDGHNSGIFTFDLLYKLGESQA